MSRIVVTGGAGRLGRSLVAGLTAAGHEIVSMLKDVLAAYDLDEETAIHTIRGFRALVHGFASLEIAGAFGMPLDVEASFDHLVAQFVRGLAPAAR